MQPTGNAAQTPTERARGSAAATAARAVRPRRKSRGRGRRWPLERRRPGLLAFVLDGLAREYGPPTWSRRRDPVEELVITILSQHTSDLNAERAFGELRRQFHDWAAVEAAPMEQLERAIASGGLAYQKAPRIKAALAHLRERGGGYSLDFLAGLPPLEARAWLTEIPGIGPKTASVVLLFSYGLPLMPVDTHVERVSRRIGLIRPESSVVDAHQDFLEMLPADRVYEAHVNLITHGRRTCTARRPACYRCPVAARCRYLDPRAP
jgi:endonuclease III